MAIETIRTANGSGRTQAEFRYFLSRSQDTPEVLASAIRIHWRAENSLHWVLDMTIREDESRVRDRMAAQCKKIDQSRSTASHFEGKPERPAKNGGMGR